MNLADVLMPSDEDVKPTLGALMSKKNKKLYAEYARKNPEKVIEKFFTIVNKEGETVPFELNDVQQKYMEEISWRDDILKARQQGFSSLILAMFTVRFLFVPNVRCVCISHEKEATTRLFARVVHYLDTLPFEVELSKKTASRLVYSPFPGDVREFYIGTAGSKAFGRGDTIHYLHISELAFWEKPGALLSGLLEAVPMNKKTTQIVKECTANGMETLHHREWLEEKNGNSTFQPIFYGWNENPDYIMAAMNTKFDEEEMQMAAEFDLSKPQLAWRRAKIKSIQTPEGYTKEDIFKQEYPLTDEEAFLSSGSPVFDYEMLKRHKMLNVKEPEMEGDFEGWTPPIFRETEGSELWVWKTPEAGVQYVLAGDVGEKTDFSCLQVYRRDNYEMMAEYLGHMDEFELAILAHKLGTWYNKATIGIERNNQGVAVVRKLDELEYPNQYQRETLDEIRNRKYNELGWKTDAKTRPIMYADLQHLMGKDQIMIRSQRTIDQLHSIERSTKNRPQARKGAHDDAVITTCIAVQLMKAMPVTADYSIIQGRNYVPRSSLSNFRRYKSGNNR